MVRGIFAERAAGASYAAIAAGLNREGIESPSGGLWTQSSLADLLRNPAYVGRSRAQPSIRHPRQEYVPIVDVAVFNQVQARAANSARRQQRTDLASVAQRLRMRRAALGLTQRAGLGASDISRLENGLRHASPAVLYALAGALETSVADLMEGTAWEDPGALRLSPARRELREKLATIERGFAWLKPAERSLMLAIVQVLAQRAAAARWDPGQGRPGKAGPPAPEAADAGLVVETGPIPPGRSPRS